MAHGSTPSRAALRGGGLLTLFCLAAAGASAHDMWIVPPEATGSGPGKALLIRMRVGHGGYHEAVRRDARRLLRLDAVRLDEASGSDAAVALPGLDGAETVGVLRPQEPGLWVVVYESRPAFSELPADRFVRYLAEEGLDAIAGLRRRQGTENDPGRELYSRSLKSLVRIGEAGGTDRPVGLPLELVVEAPDGPGTTLRLLWHGEPLGHALVEVRSLDRGGDPLSARTDLRGRVRFDLGVGAWMAATVHMEPTEGSSRAEWRSVFSTLTWVRRRNE